MKKTYTKPEIVFENFSLSTSIAAGCEASTSLHLGGQCGIKFGKEIIFLEGITGCTTKIVDGDDDYNSLCYHIPDASTNVFNS